MLDVATAQGGANGGARTVSLKDTEESRSPIGPRPSSPASTDPATKAPLHSQICSLQTAGLPDSFRTATFKIDGYRRSSSSQAAPTRGELRSTESPDIGKKTPAAPDTLLSRLGDALKAKIGEAWDALKRQSSWKGYLGMALRGFDEIYSCNNMIYGAALGVVFGPPYALLGLNWLAAGVRFKEAYNSHSSPLVWGTHFLAGLLGGAPERNSVIGLLTHNTGSVPRWREMEFTFWRRGKAEQAAQKTTAAKKTEATVAEVVKEQALPTLSKATLPFAPKASANRRAA